MRISLLSVTVAAVVIAATAATSQAGVTRVEAPRLSEMARGTRVPDATLPALARSKLLAIPPTWNYHITLPSGDSVAIYVSRQYPDDATTAQKWAGFFDSLVHGSELSSLRAYLLTPTEIGSICGRDALACYGGDQLFTPAEDPSVDLSAEAVATHEYGHHVAAHRLNDPWQAIDYGTKRWASYEQVCTKTRKGLLFPGSEDVNHYTLNPGEAFAESYRVLNERRLGLAEPPWSIVTSSLYPDAEALTLLQQDVASPWTGPTTLVRKGSVRKKSRVRNFTVSTPLDGSLKVAFRSKPRVRIDLFSASRARLAHKAGKSGSVSTTLCGQRAVRVRVRRIKGAGSFRLTISRP